jgi:hypothetical protein
MRLARAAAVSWRGGPRVYPDDGRRLVPGDALLELSEKQPRRDGSSLSACLEDKLMKGNEQADHEQGDQWGADGFSERVSATSKSCVLHYKHATTSSSVALARLDQSSPVASPRMPRSVCSFLKREAVMTCHRL